MSLARALPGAEALAAPRSSWLRFTVFFYALALLLLPLVRFGSTRAFGPQVQLCDLALGLASLCWMGGLLRGEFRLVAKRTWLPLGVYVLASGAAIFAAEDARAAAVRFVGLGYLVVLFLLTASLGDRMGYKAIILAWLGGAGLTALFGTLSALLFYLGVRDRDVNIFLWNYGSVPVGSYPRIAVLFTNANMLCNYLAVSLTAAAALWPWLEGRARRAVAWLCGGLVLTSVFTLSAGFGGIVAGAALGWVVWQRARGSFRWLRESLAIGAGVGAMLGFVVLSVWLLVPAGQGDVPLGPVDLSLETSGRVEVWSRAWDSLVEHPLRGEGLGARVPVTHARALNSMERWGTQEMTDAREPKWMEAHNVWLSIGSQSGVPGLLGFLGFCLAAAWGPLRARAASPKALFTRVSLLGGLFGALGYHGFFGAFEDSRQIWWLLGLCAVVGSRGLDGQGPRQPVEETA